MIYKKHLFFGSKHPAPNGSMNSAYDIPIRFYTGKQKSVGSGLDG